MSNRMVFAASGLVVAVLVGSGWMIVAQRQAGLRRARARDRIYDTASLRFLAGEIRGSGKLPMTDGVLDPYALVRFPNLYHVLRSRRLGGPTDEEIERRDYGNFPWGRYRGARKLADPPTFPLLWDKQPDEEGLSLVALSDGTVARWDRDTLARALSDAGR